jgi:hypothetical protein
MNETATCLFGGLRATPACLGANAAMLMHSRVPLTFVAT